MPAPAFTLAATVAVSLLFATFAQAQMVCGTRDAIVAQLGEKYGETRRGGGLAGATAIFEIWASDKPPYTWTILKTTPDGFTCVMAVGDGWQDDAPVIGTGA